MGSMCVLVSRRSFLHGVLVWFGLCSCRVGSTSTTVQTSTTENFMKLRERVVISPEDVSEHNGVYLFEAWVSPGDGPDKLLDGILLKNGDEFAAYSTYCPHEACIVKLTENPEQLKSVVADGTVLPNHEVLYCACHFSVFDPKSSGRHISGPAERGLYRFLFEEDGDTIYVTHVESSILELYG